MNGTLVYDDALPVPAEISGLIGLQRFGALLHERVRLADRAEQAARSLGLDVLRVHSAGDAHALAARLSDASPDARFVYATADIVAEPDLFRRFLGKLAYAEHDTIAVPSAQWPTSLAASLAAPLVCRLLGGGPVDRRVALTDARGQLDDIPADGLACLSDADTLVRFLSGSFYTRAFNRMRHEGRVVVKSSSDVAKMRREHDFWYLLPDALKRYVVQPFDYAEADGVASYRLERLHITDAAVQWIHGLDGLPPDAFDALLDGVFGWLAERPTKRVTAEEGRAVAEQLYVGKLEQRVSAFLATEAGREVERAVGVRALVQRCTERLAGGGLGGETLAVTHGDLCLSNVLFDRRTRLVKLIDPRGAASEAELWGDPSYDVAKLSHSILGGYDFVNHGLFDVVAGEDLRLVVRLDRPPLGVREQRFVERLAAMGFDLARIRTCEASLFLSMLPLHAEAPRKTLAFALIARDLLDSPTTG